MKQPIVLRIFMNGQAQGVKQLVGSQIIIGRSPDAQLELNDESVSPLHTLIEEREDGHYLSDLGSELGTLVDGERILDQKIKSGDQFQVGPYTIHFFAPTLSQDSAVGEKPQATAPPAGKDSTTQKPLAPPPKSVPSEEPKAAPSVPPPFPSAKKPKVASSPILSPPPPPSAPAPFEKSEAAPSPEPHSVSPPSVRVSSSKKGKSSFQQGPKSLRPGTFAPTSQVKSAGDLIRPDKGTIVEVLIVWQERVISSHHFHGKRSVTIGTDDKCDIMVPLLGMNRTQHKLLRIGTLATVCVSPDMTGDYIESNLNKVTFSELMRRGGVQRGPAGYELEISQGDMLRIGLQGDLVSIYIRYVPETSKPLAAPLLNLTASELTGLVLAVAVATVIGLYMMIYSPSSIDNEDLLEEPLRKAVVVFSPRKKIVEDMENPPPRQVVPVKQEPKKSEQRKAVKPQKKPVRAQQKTPKPSQKPGRAAEVRPNRKKNRIKKLTSTRQGGGRKTGKSGSSTKSKKPDPSKVGLLGVFSNQGTQKDLDQIYAGSGELQGAADGATGFSGQEIDRKGENIGTRTRNTGVGGKGAATVGISGVGTKGRGAGDFKQGTGGLGKKGSASINIGGQEAEFVGSLDREAIRRVILKNKSIIRNCYDRELNKNKNLYGKLVLQWNIVERGRVTKVKVVSSTLASSAVGKCITARLKTWRFPEPPPNTEGQVTYPFVFASQ